MIYLVNMIPAAFWPEIYQNLKESNTPLWEFQMKWLFIFTNSALLLVNLLYMCIYKMALPSLEKYKTQRDRPWPWNEDPEEWKILRRKTIL